ncbi:hypothetical protein OG978_18065 [Streptomyces sp. NBC_01591]|uniref:hypothetical protein n=1 Tax=Streptomyces sp. NBC_01591 TaxID=2975888 RepID=UPI002DD7F0A1|nr:hypothetical protein [Streptomyces sp. NBC_01591]WSD69141.1 hypothetical protein OG978_18065 [Streptomyces sp. NBC_01591]
MTADDATKKSYAKLDAMETAIVRHNVFVNGGAHFHVADGGGAGQSAPPQSSCAEPLAGAT